MLSKLACLFFILYFGINFCASQDDLPEMDTPLGRVRGFWKTSYSRKYAAFEGIPYAKPPVADLRFEEPQPIPPWSGIWEANAPHTCLQTEWPSPNAPFGEEDCLYLNVYVPEEFVKHPKDLDVIVSIHGGAFMVGSGHMILAKIPDVDAVIVSLNYRLGILGFLSTEDGAIPGNNGMKDQVLALKWVQDNIASFGGNPDSVTIIGMSAGGASVHLHYFSPLSKGLFHKGLSQSGTALGPWVIRKNALQRAKKLATLVGCPGSPSEELKRCLKQRPAHTLLNQMVHFFGYQSLPFSPFAPVVEKGSENAFLDREPYELLKQGKVLDVPWITSCAADDGLLPSALFWKILDEVNEKWVEIAADVLDYNDTVAVSERDTVAKEILEYYLGVGEEITKDNFNQFTQIFTDRLFAVPAELAAKMQARASKSPVYFYIFNYSEGENGMAYFFSGSEEVTGVAHGDDGIYFYGTLIYKPLSKQDERMTTACHNMLYSFANTSIPSFDGSDTWQSTGPDKLTFLIVNGPDSYELQMAEKLTPSDFWSKLGLLENENLIVKDEL